MASPHPILGASRCVPVLVGFVADNSGSTAGSAGDKATYPFFSFPSSGKMRDIMAGMDEKDRECCCSSTSPLYMTVTCPVFVLPRCTGLWTLLGDDFRIGFRISSVRQWIHFLASFFGCFWKNFIFST